jgi:hypothetical protein
MSAHDLIFMGLFFTVFFMDAKWYVKCGVGVVMLVLGLVGFSFGPHGL